MQKIAGGIITSASAAHCKLLYNRREMVLSINVAVLDHNPGPNPSPAAQSDRRHWKAKLADAYRPVQAHQHPTLIARIIIAAYYWLLAQPIIQERPNVVTPPQHSDWRGEAAHPWCGSSGWFPVVDDTSILLPLFPLSCCGITVQLPMRR